MAGRDGPAQGLPRHLSTTLVSPVRGCMADQEEPEPTPDEICFAVHEMFCTLLMLDALIDNPKVEKGRVPFEENVRAAVKRYDTPRIRGALVKRIYGEEW
jgi:hypothetical protein